MPELSLPMRSLLALIAGGLTTLAFPPFDWWPLAIGGPVLLLCLLDGQTVFRAAWLGWLFGLAHFISGVWWVLISTHVYGGAPLFLAVFLWLLLSAYLGLFPALAALIFRSGPGGGLAFLLVWPAAWLLGELARGWIMGGFPWFSLGYVATAWPPLLKFAPLVGAHGLSLLLMLLAGAIALLLCRRAPVPLVFVVITLGVALGQLPSPARWTEAQKPSLSVALIQGNIPQDQKWAFFNRLPTMQLYQALTAQAWPADLVIWPEVAIPAPLRDVEGYFQDMDEEARAAGGTLFASVLTYQADQAYNTVYALGLDQGRYVKQHLVPFGEYVPAPDWLRPVFDVLNLPIPGISTGLPGEPVLRVGSLVVSMSICFEDVFPLEVRQTARDAGVLVNVTNDAWFAGSAAPQQHLQIAQLRAAESGRTMLRVANTGISAVVGPDGLIVDELGWSMRGVLRHELVPREGQTPFQRYGHWPLYGWLALALIGLLHARRRLVP